MHAELKGSLKFWCQNCNFFGDGEKFSDRTLGYIVNQLIYTDLLIADKTY